VSKDGRATARPPSGPFDLYQFSSQQYAWHEAGENGYPARSEPPSHETIDTLARGVALPPYSLTIVRSAPDDAKPSAMTKPASLTGKVLVEGKGKGRE